MSKRRMVMVSVEVRSGTARGLGERWKRVDRAFHLGVDLPAVELYELGGSYFVVDGNHRGLR